MASKISTLKDFLTQNPIEGLEKEITLSKRLKDFKFKIRAITQKELQEAYDMVKASGGNDSVASYEIILKGLIEPDFQDSEWIKENGVDFPEELITKTLNIGEINKLSSSILELSGLNDDFDEAMEEAKN